MNQTTTKIVSLICCAALGLGTIGAAYIVRADQETETQETSTQESTEVNTSHTSQTASGESSNISKDETVYIMTEADGSVQKVIVSDWLNNALSASQISDVTNLMNIENVKGDETYTAGSGNAAVWDAQGNDIYYQGSTDQEIPVSLHVSYKLDGKDISPDELAGKSGKVTIRYEYENNQYEMVTIDGKKEKIYVPFAMLTGMLLDNENFRHVEVTNGKITNDGDRTVVIGVAFPGLQDDLALDKDKIEIPDYVEVTADVTDFSLGMAVTVATNQLFSDLDTSDLDSVDELQDALDELTDGMDQLLDGSSELYDGVSTLLDKTGDLTDGVSQLSDGAKALQDGAGTLDDGAAQVESGLKSLSSGLNELSDNNSTLTDGAKQVFETLLATANSQLAEAGLNVQTLTIDNYGSVLNATIESLDDTNVYNQALAQVTAAVEDNRSLIEEKVTEAVREQVEEKVIEAVRPQVQEKVEAAAKEQVTEKVTAVVQEQVTEKVTAAVKEQVTAQVLAKVLATKGMTADQYNAAVSAGLISADDQAAVSAAVSNAVEAQMATDDVKATISDNVDKQMATDDVQATISDNVDKQMATDDVQALIASNTDEQMKTDDVQEIIRSNTDAQMQTESIQTTIQENVKDQVQLAIDENMGSDAVQSQLTAASEGAKSIIALKSSLDSYNKFYVGLKTYTEGVAAAAEGCAQLYTGATALSDGTGALKTGASDLYDGVGTLKDGVDAFVDGISQLKDGAGELSDGLVKFNEEGIQKIVDAVDGDVNGLIDRVKATADVSRNYRNFSGISDSMDGKVTFIYRIGEIKEESTSTNE
jgi:putative membrane protein